MYSFLFTPIAFAFLALAHPQARSSLPVVDLGYTLQRATTYNSTGDYYTFSNVRYAQSPAGNLRWTPRLPPAVNRTIQTGEQDCICYQATPKNFADYSKWAIAVLEGENTTALINEALHPSGYSASQVPKPDPRETEDCLFLDVTVPQKTYTNKGRKDGAPVLVWIHGGGDAFGYKTAGYDPSGLLAESVRGTGQEIIFVSLNYRLGAFGFLSGPTLQTNGIANAGLLDQRFALEWVRDHIKEFGGNSDKITVIGESGAGGAIMSHITSYGGNKGPLPFQQAILQSPDSLTSTSNFDQEEVFQGFLNASNLKSLQELRSASGESLRVANYVQISAAPWGSFVYSAAIDGDYVTGTPGELLLSGAYHKDLRGLTFAPPYTETNAGYLDYLRGFISHASPCVIDYVSQILYPPIFNGSYPFTTPVQRAALTAGEALFTCPTNWLARAYANATYNYEFAVPPALHTLDLDYTFYNGTQSEVVPGVAATLQRYVTSFAVNGRPTAEGTVEFVEYGDEGNVQVLSEAGVKRMRDVNLNERCAWWQKSLYY